MAVKRDFRKLASAGQAELHRLAVAMVRAGKTRTEAAETWVSRRFSGKWVKAASRPLPGRAERSGAAQKPNGDQHCVAPVIDRYSAGDRLPLLLGTITATTSAGAIDPWYARHGRNAGQERRSRSDRYPS